MNRPALALCLLLTLGCAAAARAEGSVILRFQGSAIKGLAKMLQGLGLADADFEVLAGQGLALTLYPSNLEFINEAKGHMLYDLAFDGESVASIVAVAELGIGDDFRIPVYSLDYSMEAMLEKGVLLYDSLDAYVGYGLELAVAVWLKDDACELRIVSYKEDGTIESAWAEMKCVNLPASVSLRLGAKAPPGPRGASMVPVKAGSYAVQGGKGSVELSAYLIADAELTRGEFKAFVDATGFRTSAEIMGWAITPGWATTPGASWRNPGFVQKDGDPVVCVSWYDLIEYCNWRSAREGLAPAYRIDKLAWDQGNLNPDDPFKWTVGRVYGADGYRLPTEAEWTVAAQGGVRGKGLAYAGSADSEDVAWTALDAEGAIHPGRGKKPNELGAFDMSGNAWEWCWDWWGGSLPAGGSDPAGPSKGSFRFVRGGGAFDAEALSAIAHRGHFGAGFLSAYSFGARLARSFE